MMCLGAIGTWLAPSSAAAQAGGIVDYAAYQELKQTLSGRPLLLEVLPEPAQYQDPGLVAARYGQGATVVIDDRQVIVTSWFLTQGASKIMVQKPDGRARQASASSITDLSVARVADDLVETRVISELPDYGLAILELPDSVARMLVHKPGPPGILDKPDPTRVLYCISPVSPGISVLTDTAVTDKAGPPLERLFLAPGFLPPGTVIFDGAGTPVAVAAREAFSGAKFTLVAPISGAISPKPAVKAAPEQRNIAPAQPGVWVDTTEGATDEGQGQ